MIKVRKLSGLDNQLYVRSQIFRLLWPHEDIDLWGVKKWFFSKKSWCNISVYSPSRFICHITTHGKFFWISSGFRPAGDNPCVCVANKIVCWDGIDPFMSIANFCLWGCIVREIYELSLFNKNLRFDSFRLTTGCCPPASSVTLKMHQSSKSTFCKFPGGTVEERQRNYFSFAIMMKSTLFILLVAVFILLHHLTMCCL